MKTSAWFIVCMAAATFMSALTPSNFDFIKCRNYASELKNEFSTIQLIEHDLINGSWTGYTAKGVNNNYLFSPEGSLQIISTDKDGHKAYQATIWKIAELNGQAFLVLTDEGHKEQLLKINQTCEGITLHDLVSKDVLSLGYQPLKASARLSLTKANMIGDWTNVSILEVEEMTSQAKGAFFEYQFLNNGTFSCYYGNSTNRVAEKGTWDISNDGQFLLLNVANENDVERTNCARVIRITQVDDHGLVLEQVMKSNVVNEFFGSDNKTYAFIR